MAESAQKTSPHTSLDVSKTTKTSENKHSDNPQKIFRRDNEEYKIVKKLPKRFPTNFNDIYVTNKTDFKAQYERCSKILFGHQDSKNEQNEIVLHAIGPAINTAINLALKLKKFKDCTISCLTSSIELEDDLIPLMDHLDVTFQHRNLSAVHIKIIFNCK